MNKKERIANAIKNAELNEKIMILDSYRMPYSTGRVQSIGEFDAVVSEMFEENKPMEIMKMISKWHFFFEDKYFREDENRNIITMTEDEVNEFIDSKAEEIAEYCERKNEYLCSEIIRKAMNIMTDEEIEEKLDEYVRDLGECDYIDLYNFARNDAIHTIDDMDYVLSDYFEDMSFTDILEAANEIYPDAKNSEYFRVTSYDEVEWYNSFYSLQDETVSDLIDAVLMNRDCWSSVPEELAEAFEYYGTER